MSKMYTIGECRTASECAFSDTFEVGALSADYGCLPQAPEKVTLYRRSRSALQEKK